MNFAVKGLGESTLQHQIKLFDWGTPKTLEVETLQKCNLFDCVMIMFHLRLL